MGLSLCLYPHHILHGCIVNAVPLCHFSSPLCFFPPLYIRFPRLIFSLFWWKFTPAPAGCPHSFEKGHLLPSSSFFSSVCVYNSQVHVHSLPRVCMYMYCPALSVELAYDGIEKTQGRIYLSSSSRSLCTEEPSPFTSSCAALGVNKGPSLIRMEILDDSSITLTRKEPAFDESN